MVALEAEGLQNSYVTAESQDTKGCMAVEGQPFSLPKHTKFLTQHFSNGIEFTIPSGFVLVLKNRNNI